MTTYGVGIWWAGWVGGGHLAAYLAHPECWIGAIGSRQLESARSLAKHFKLSCPLRTDYAAFLAQPGLDVVSICISPPASLEHHQGRPRRQAPLRGEADCRDPLRPVPDARGGAKSGCPDGGRFRREVDTPGGAITLDDQGGGSGPSVHDRRGLLAFAHAPGDLRRRATGGQRPPAGGCHAIDAARFLIGADPIEVTARSVQVPSQPETPMSSTA